MESHDFSKWLNSTKEHFKTLNEAEKTQTLAELLQLCGPEQLLFLTQTYLPLNCRIDFLTCLPNEISERILCYLDVNSVHSCCLVSKSWNTCVSLCKKLWTDLVWHIGGARQVVLNKPARVYRNQFIRRRAFLATSQQGLYESKEYCQENFDGFCVWSYRQDRFAVSGKGSQRVFLGTIDSPDDGVSVRLECAVRAMAMDQQYLYIASDTIACAYDLQKFHLYQRFQGHVRCLLSIDGDSVSGLVVTGSADCTVKLWNLHTADIIFSSQLHHVGWVCHVKILMDLNSSTQAFMAYDSNAYLSVWTVNKLEHSEVWTVQHVDDLLTDMKRIPLPAIDKCGFFVFQKPIDVYQTNFCIVAYYNLVLKHLENHKYKLKFIKHIDINHRFQDMLAIGDRFTMYTQVTLEKLSVCVYDLHGQRPLLKVPLPEPLPVGSWAVYLEKHDWLSGFTSTNLPNSLFCVLEPQNIHRHQTKSLHQVKRHHVP
ncbi:F-box/WD repeat-containing protein 2-like [Mizuhopecten yessoensis]|uniref:F-box/WD repeat-containing protein 2 n=1 Tax=Mizuhopecten yessoensis TaxID=6573 RepID=A0A210QZD4_MIZYE|nr:F-box/WD repeat-containing protein 2-like [Mizuhopecten yessoensis]XP_021346078.1 F-box/WD repeat-containing protein 2-like [Mizuhopecten yessoensis]OWF54087.1 F-box/WD repeat-containing protein 2 [Mizuhopecten yessoensis]